MAVKADSTHAGRLGSTPSAGRKKGSWPLQTNVACNISLYGQVKDP